MSETLNISSLCRCCLTEGEFRSLDAPYKCDEIDSYSALLRETFNITINPMPGPENASTYAICDGCTSRLQDAAQFRNQVLECVTKFAAYVENYLRADCSFSADKIQIQAETLQDEEIEHIKEIENVNAMNEEIEHIKEEIKNVNAMSADEGDNYFNEFDCKIEVCDDGNRIGDARHSCGICNEIFCRKDKLRSHVPDNYIFSQDSRDLSGLSCDRAFNRAEYHCAFCTDTFPKLKSLKSHELAHTEKSGLICDYCQKSFNDKNKLKNHIYRHTGNCICETCGYFTKRTDYLRKHIRNVHEKIRAFQCDQCPKTYKTKNDLIEHRRAHTGEFPHKCDVCFKSFRFQTNFVAHKRRHLLKSFKQDQARITESLPKNLNNKCPICGKSFKYKYLLRTHLNTHTKPFQCDVCSKSFSNNSSMVHHQKQHYPGERETKTERKNCSGVNRTDNVDYSCDFCKQIFCGKETLRSHLLAKHMSLDPRNISCPLCGIKFKARDRCLKHLMLHKTAQYHCDFCIDTFPTPSSLRTHEETHTKKSGYICDYCHRGFKQKFTLGRHINVKHMFEFSYKIKRTHATQESVLKKDVRAVHDKIRPLKCDVCPKTYKTKKHLLNHKKDKHTGVPPYKCDVCSQSFRSKSLINQHKLRYKH